MLRFRYLLLKILNPLVLINP